MRVGDLGHGGLLGRPATSLARQLVIEPYLADLEAGRGGQIWAEAGLTVGPVGRTVIACREHKTGHEIGSQGRILLASLEMLYDQPG